jgi:acyl-CoA thioester hydrolase
LLHDWFSGQCKDSAVTEKQVVETTFYVRYAETDQMGLVHHSAYIVWFEEGRSSWMRAMGSNYADFEASGLNLAVSEVYARYQAAALYGRRVTVRTWMEELRSRTAKICYGVLDTESGRTLVTGHTRHVCVDRKGKVVRIPERWRELLQGNQ